METRKIEVVVTAVGPDKVGLADPIIHFVTSVGGNFSEIQMYDHDEAEVFAMLCRVQVDASQWEHLHFSLRQIGEIKGLSVRVWSPDLPEVLERKARIALCTTFQEPTPKAILEAVSGGKIDADIAVMIGNRKKCEKLAAEYGVPWHMIGDDKGHVDDDELVPATGSI